MGNIHVTQTLGSERQCEDKKKKRGLNSKRPLCGPTTRSRVPILTGQTDWCKSGNGPNWSGATLMNDAADSYHKIHYEQVWSHQMIMLFSNISMV